MEKMDRWVLISVGLITTLLITIIVADLAHYLSKDKENGSEDRYDNLPYTSQIKRYYIGISISNSTPHQVEFFFNGFDIGRFHNDSYLLDFGDGTHSGWIHQGNITHTYEVLDRYTVKLYAPTGNRTVQFMDQRIIDITKWGMNPPIAVIRDTNPTYYMDEQPVMLSGYGSYDIDGEVIGYYWDFGDGTHSDLSTGIKDGFQPTKVASHMYDSPGDYIVKLWVMDDNYVKSEEPAEIKVRIVSSRCVA